ncbi:MAG: polymer-forming cytoskeletal protein [Caldilineaceae bacterium]|nr:polymer-forming cytoskeletal protein [Caldilineaceae bacterium]
MFYRNKSSRRGRRWGRVFLLLVGLALVAGIARLTSSAGEHKVEVSQAPAPAFSDAGVHFFSEDVVIDAHERYEDDVVVYSGNVQIKDGGRIQGDLTVYSGNVTIDEEAEVQGRVTALSGNVRVRGQVGGDLVVGSGDIDLAETAWVGGAISVMSGRIDRSEGARVSGNIIAGGFKLPALPAFLGARPVIPTAPAAPAAPPAPNAPAMPPIDMRIDRASTLSGMILGLLGRLLLAAFGTSLIILVAGLVYYVRPHFVVAIQATMQQQRPLSFAIGLMSNLVLIFLTGALMITLCLAPVGLAAGLLFGAINLLGWSALSLSVGQWLFQTFKIEGQPLVALLVGAFLMTSVLALGWIIGGYLRPMIYLLGLVITACGSGAVVVHWLRLGATPRPDQPLLLT